MKQEHLSGILVVDKPKGMTSHDVVNIARRMFKIRRIGHAGTLDPIATGVLIILVGKATKKSSEFMAYDKEYDVTLRLGEATDTGDAEGVVIRTADIGALTENEITKTIFAFEGEIQQVPPMYSAIKFRGKRLYKLARKGITVDRKPRRVTVKKISIRGISPPDVRFDILCSKGTYIRQLCADIGERLGCGAYMTALRRTRSGNFHISQAKSIDEFASMADNERNALLIRTD